MDMFDILGITQLMEWGRKTFKEEKSPSPQIEPVKFQFRPRTLNEYIGQEQAKDLVRLNIYKAQNIKQVHFLLSGTKGTGKSSLAFIIANELKFKIHTYIAGTFTMENLREFLLENEQNRAMGHILFIDEIHNIKKDMGEFLYPVLEDFILPIENNPEIRPFIFMGATTEKSTLLKKLAPMADRIGCQIQLANYTPQDIQKILRQYNEQIYKKIIPQEVYEILSYNTRYTPRIALAYFDDYIVCEDVWKVLKIHRIIKNGLTDDDIKILKHLAEINKPVGEQALAVVCNATVEDYRQLIEPFLLQEGYLTRTGRGRLIMDKGKEILLAV